jgi:type II secretory pathway component PulF
MEDQIFEKLEQLEAKTEAVHKSVEKIRKYFLATLVVSLLMFMLPLIALIFVIPFFLNIITSFSGML